MPLAHAPRRIAIIGGGIAGLGAAHLLAKAQHQITLFEAAPRLGGHARTLLAGKRGDQPVDTGFIVFNKATYPHLCALFDELEVPICESNMSFAASTLQGRLEYGLAGLGTLFAQRRNLLRPAYLGMLRDILRFFGRAEAICARAPDLTIGQLLDRLGSGDWFRDHFLTPFSGAIWSTPTRGILDFPATSLVSFFRNHGLMGLSGQHQWYTVRGGSVEYVRRIETALRRLGADLRIGAPVEMVRREAGRIRLRPRGGLSEDFDEVILACHSDQSLSLLADATPEERRLLSAIRYQPNEAVLHSDQGQMPARRKLWSAWNYIEGQDPSRISLTYWMNCLQPIPMEDPLFVTLNPSRPIRPDLVQDITTFYHPVYDQGALEAQRQIAAQNGARGTWFAGAWLGHGFHEDGLASAHRIAKAMAARGGARPLAAVA